MSDSADGPETLPASVSAFLMEFGGALNRRGMYPPGHPALAEAAGRLAERAQEALREHGPLTLAVARRSLVFGEAASDPAQPVLRDLSDRLHRRRVGGLKLDAGFDASDAGQLLDVLGPEPGPEEPGPAPWESAHAALLPTRYDRLALAGEDADAPVDSVWGQLARSALTGGTGGESGADVARAINQRAGDATFDRALSGQLSDLLMGDDEPLGETVASEIADLIRTLDPSRLRRLVELAGGLDTVSELVKGAADRLPPDAVLLLLEAGRGPGQSVSDSMMRILGKLAAHAPGTPRTAAAPDRALRDQVREIVDDWTLDDPNPESYSSALQRLTSRRPNRLATAREDQRPPSLRVAQMALELDATGPRVRHAMAALVEEDPTGLLQAVLGAPPPSDGQAGMDDGDPPESAVDVAWGALGTPAALGSLLASSAPGDPTVERLIERAGAPAIPALLDRLASSEDRTERHWILNRLTAMGDVVVEPAMARLDGAPWFLTRNLLVLLRRVGAHDALPPDPYLAHADPRVRLEAARLFAGGTLRARAIEAAVADDDPDVAAAGLELAAEASPPSIASLLPRKIADESLEEEARSIAVRLAADHPTEASREALLDVVLLGRTLVLRRLRFAEARPLVLEAIAALVRGWPSDPEVVEMREAALSGKNGAIRVAAKGSR